MGARRTGVLTVPGYLTHFLDEFDLTRKEISQRLGVSVRTVHNIEHGRRRVDPRVLNQLAAELNRFAEQLPHGRKAPLALTGDHFASSPESIAMVFLQTIMLNRPEMLYVGDDPVASPDFRWIAPGNPQAIPFAGVYAGMDVQQMLAVMHRTIQLEAIDGVRILANRNSSIVTVRTLASYRHPLSRNLLTFKAYVDIDMAGNKLGVIDSTYDANLISEFLQSGLAPQR